VRPTYTTRLAAPLDGAHSTPALSKGALPKHRATDVKPTYATAVRLARATVATRRTRDVRMLDTVRVGTRSSPRAPALDVRVPERHYTRAARTLPRCIPLYPYYTLPHW